MSIEKRNLALPAIVAVAVIITVNAVVDQDGKHPAPIGNKDQHEKIIRSKTPLIDDRILKRKTRQPGTAAVIPRSKPEGLIARTNEDAIARILNSASGAKN